MPQAFNTLLLSIWYVPGSRQRQSVVPASEKQPGWVVHSGTCTCYRRVEWVISSAQDVRELALKDG